MNLLKMTIGCNDWKPFIYAGWEIWGRPAKPARAIHDKEIVIFLSKSTLSYGRPDRLVV